MIWIYNFLITMTAPIWVPLIWWRARKRQEKPNWKERYGDYSLDLDRARPVIWLHAVSVGEVVAAIPVLKALREKDQSAQLVMSVTTSTGHQTARDRALAPGLADHLVYFPIDVARFMWMATWRVRPHAVAIFETELWLNFLHFSKQSGATTLLVNGRISDRSFRRSRWVRFYYQTLMEKLDRALMQTQADAERIRAFGAKSIEVFGNTKFDEAVTPSAEERAQWRAEIGAGPEDFVVVVGSTRGAIEETFVLEALSQLIRPGIRIVHAPRHVEGADDLERRIVAAVGAVARRSRGEKGQYLLLDTYGELSGVYAAADVAVVGGGFERLGGQNLIQPLACGIPVIHGPHMHNFRDVADAASRAGATGIVSTSTELFETLSALVSNPERRSQMGNAGRELVEANRGASGRYAEAIVVAARPNFEAEQIWQEKNRQKKKRST